MYRTEYTALSPLVLEQLLWHFVASGFLVACSVNHFPIVVGCGVVVLLINFPYLFALRSAPCSTDVRMNTVSTMACI